jgi:hypothetical protein
MLLYLYIEVTTVMMIYYNTINTENKKSFSRNIQSILTL